MQRPGQEGARKALGTALGAWTVVGALLAPSGSRAEPSPAVRCEIDRIGQRERTPDVPVLSAATPFKVTGWLVDTVSGRVPLRARLRLTPANGGQPADLALRRWHQRADVARTFRRRVYIVAGFEVEVPPGTLTPGRWGLSLVYERSGIPQYCEDGAVVEISSPKRP